MNISTLTAFLAATTLSLTCHASSDARVDAATRTAVIEALITQMNEKYVSPETARQVEARLRSELGSGAYNLLTDADAFAQQLTTTLQTVARDRHLHVRHTAEEMKVEPAAMRQDPGHQAELARRIKFHSGVVRVERMSGNIGYLKVDFFPPAEHMAEIYGAAMTILNGTEALVIDLRDNRGGEPSGVALLESYFFDKPTLMNTIYNRAGNTTEEFWTSATLNGPRYSQANPVYILTSPKTFSGGEDLAYSMQAQRRATVVGATTGGGANPGSVRRLHKHFSAFISDGRAINPLTKTNWEGVGVKPDVAVAPDDALRQARMLALKSIASRITDPRGRAELAALLQSESAAGTRAAQAQ